ncbi:MAG: hypothetical protein K940chlam9_00680 [Chlamydiae bacterium]|nr:hypothetical protein [Chlamydiota bacterium]
MQVHSIQIVQAQERSQKASRIEERTRWGAIAASILLLGALGVGAYFGVQAHLASSSLLQSLPFKIALGSSVSFGVLALSLVIASVYQRIQKQKADEGVVQVDPLEKPQNYSGTVYIHSSASFLIHADGLYQFSQNLTDWAGEPIPVGPEDFYVEVEGDFGGKQHFIGCHSGAIYFPSPLLEGKDNGDEIKFRFKGHKYLLTCAQMGDFAAAFEFNRVNLLRLLNTAIYADELIGSTYKMVEYSKIHSITSLFNRREELVADLSFFEEDEKTKGQYQEMRSSLVVPSNNFVYPQYVFLPHIYGDPEANVYLIETENRLQKRHLWVIIPHYPSELLGREILSSNRPDRRPAGYHGGRYASIPLASDDQWEVVPPHESYYTEDWDIDVSKIPDPPLEVTQNETLLGYAELHIRIKKADEK